MPLPLEFLQTLKERNDIEEVISSYVTLKRTGRNAKGLCPFHGEKTPSFTVYKDSASFFCFGCGAGGDVITFIRKIENLDYMDAVRFLAQRAGLEVPEDNYSNSKSGVRTDILEANRMAARFYFGVLSSEEGKIGLDYFHKRQITDATIKRFGLGFAPNSWDSLYKHLKGKFSDETLILAGLCMRGRNGGIYDKFRNRVMFPIIDIRGNVIAFGGRVMDDSKPKYLNTSDTPVFKKSNGVFAMNLAKEHCKESIILAEGYMDVIAMHQAGFRNAVATLGTALTPEQGRLMSRYTEQVIVAYDSDEPGQKAANRAIGILKPTGLKVKILSIPKGKDPDEYIKKEGSARFENLIKNSGSDVEFKLNKLRGQFDLASAEGKVGFMDRAIGVLASLTDSIECDVYATKLSEELKINKDIIVSRVKGAKKANRTKESRKQIRDIELNTSGYGDNINKEKRNNIKAATAEECIIALLLQNPNFYDVLKNSITGKNIITQFNRGLYEKIMEMLGDGVSNTESIVAGLNSCYSVEEMSYIAKIMSNGKMLNNSKDELNRYIKILQEENQKKAPEEISKLPDEDYNSFFNKLREQKK